MAHNYMKTEGGWDPRQIARMKRAARWAEAQEQARQGVVPAAPPHFLADPFAPVPELQEVWALAVNGIPACNVNVAPLPVYPVTASPDQGDPRLIWQVTDGTDSDGNPWLPGTIVYTCGSASCKLFWMDGGGNFMPIEICTTINDDGTVAIDQASATIYNWGSQAVPPNSFVKAKMENLIYIVWNSDCP